jgi:hypothetical protein
MPMSEHLHEVGHVPQGLPAGHLNGANLSGARTPTRVRPELWGLRDSGSGIAYGQPLKGGDLRGGLHAHRQNAVPHHSSGSR